jgi:hypothetical protein
MTIKARELHRYAPTRAGCMCQPGLHSQFRLGLIGHPHIPYKNRRASSIFSIKKSTILGDEIKGSLVRAAGGQSAL